MKPFSGFEMAMRTLFHVRRCGGWLLLAALATLRGTAAPVQSNHVESELVAETLSIQPGQPFTVGLRLTMEEHWHTYWLNPGDSGMATTIKWTLPDGFTAGPIQWPRPIRIPTPPLMTYGYEGEVLLLTEITPPADVAPDTKVTLRARGDWLVCRDLCLPGGADHALELPVSAAKPRPDVTHAFLFAQARRSLPAADANSWRASFAVADKELVLRVTPPAGTQVNPADAYFFSTAEMIVEPAAPQHATLENDALVLRLPRAEGATGVPAKLEGVLTAAGGFPPQLPDRAVLVSAQPADGAAAASATAAANSGANSAGAAAAGAGAASATTLGFAIGFAFLGGLILNLMPCVFPVLSIKIVSFVQQAGGDRSRMLRHGLVFAAGVLVSFWALASMLLALRAAGAQVGWGFQFQSPAVVMAVGAVVFVMALVLLGVCEVGGSLIGLAARTGGEGYAGSFGTGVLATVVATPCTAPFMGTALAFALAQPAGVSLAVFSALGLGMALPYVLLSAFPAGLRLLPKPGAWMETFKQAMAFPLLATVVWLIWVLAIQIGPDGVLRFLVALLLLGLGAWVLGRWATPVRSTATRSVSRACALGFAALAVWLGVQASALQPAAAAATATERSGAAGVAWEAYTPQRFEELRAAGKPVFIDFTAAWCITCKANEFVAFRSADVGRRFAELGITALKADWTARSPDVTQALARYGRNSVPLYVLYGAGRDAEPRILPQLLNPALVIDALEQSVARESTQTTPRPLASN